jgi:hypothetical protein
MDLGRPLLTISPGSSGRVLTALARSGRPVSGNEAARRAGVSRTTAVGVLDQLVDAGLVWSTRLPHATLFMLDPEHLLTPIVRRIVTLVGDLAERVDQFCTQWSVPPAWVGIAEVDSDASLQLLVVPPRKPISRREWEEQLAALRGQAGRWTGCEVTVSQAPVPVALDQLEEVWRGPVYTAHGTAPPGVDVVRSDAPDAPPPISPYGARSWQL